MVCASVFLSHFSHCLEQIATRLSITEHKYQQSTDDLLLKTSKLKTYPCFDPEISEYTTGRNRTWMQVISPLSCASGSLSWYNWLKGRKYLSLNHLHELHYPVALNTNLLLFASFHHLVCNLAMQIILGDNIPILLLVFSCIVESTEWKLHWVACLCYTLSGWPVATFPLTWAQL